MPIFIVTEQVMNGTVTLKVITSGIRARNFKKAKEKLVVALDKVPEYHAVKNDENSFLYSTPDLIGIMTNEPLKML